jgi:hypothetical protein
LILISDKKGSYYVHCKNIPIYFCDELSKGYIWVGERRVRSRFIRICNSAISINKVSIYVQSLKYCESPPPPKKNSNNHICLSKLVLYYASFGLCEIFTNASSYKMRPHCYSILSGIFLRPEIHQIRATYAEVVSYISSLYFSIPLHDIFNIQYISPSLLQLS